MDDRERDGILIASLIITVVIVTICVIVGLTTAPARASGPVIDLRSPGNPARRFEQPGARVEARRMAAADRLCKRFGLGAPIEQPQYDWTRLAWAVKCFPARFTPGATYTTILTERLPR